MVDRDIIIRRITLLEEYLRDLREVAETTTLDEFRSDKIIQRYAERTLHMAIEACLDLANHVISFEGFREPTSNQDHFEVLWEQGLLEQELKDNLRRMGQFRNLLVHDYARVDPSIVFKIITKDLVDLREFANIIKDAFL